MIIGVSNREKEIIDLGVNTLPFLAVEIDANTLIGDVNVKK